jgi:hypothetical protein
MAEDEKMPLNDEINTKDLETGLKRSFLGWLRPLRLMSKSFDRAITPIAYHSYDLSRWPIMRKLVEYLGQEAWMEELEYRLALTKSWYLLLLSIQCSRTLFWHMAWVTNLKSREKFWLIANTSSSILATTMSGEWQQRI